MRRLALRHDISLLCYGDESGTASAVIRDAGISLYTVEPVPNPGKGGLYLSLLGNLLSRDPYSVSKHWTRRYNDRLARLLRQEQFDLVHCEWTPYAQYLGDAGGPPSLVMAHNIESQIWFRRAQHSRSPWERVFFWLQAKKMENFERRVACMANSIAAVTSLDAEQMRAWGARRVTVVDNGVDLAYFSPAEDRPESFEMVFLGSLDWYANLDAVEHMLDAIYPLIRAREPRARFTIVGRKPPEALARRVAAMEGVELIGEVPDVRPFLGRAAVVVVPLRIGGGSRIKILEALAMSKAVVSTSVGSEGLNLTDGTHLMLEDQPAGFAQRTVELLHDVEARRHLGEAGRKLVVQSYSWDRMADKLEAAWLELAAKSDSVSEGMHKEVSAIQ